MLHHIVPGAGGGAWINGLLGAAAGRAGGGATPPEPTFQPYIFWAYGLACLFLLAFTVWNIVELKRVGRRVDYLAERLEGARRRPGEKPHGEQPAQGN